LVAENQSGFRSGPGAHPEHQPRTKNSAAMINPVATIPARSGSAGIRRAMRALK